MTVMTKGRGTMLALTEDGIPMPLMFRRTETRVIEAAADASRRLVVPLGAEIGVVTLIATGALWFNHGGASVAAADPLTDGQSGYLGAGGSLDLPLLPGDRYLAARAAGEACRLYVMIRG